jgi:hypothetical protein
MKRLLLPAIFIFSSVAFAQITSEKFLLEWTKGVVIFKTGDTLACDLRFNQTGALPILQIRKDDHTLTVPTKDVKQFSFYDVLKTRKRSFASFENPNSPHQQFYMEKIYGDSHFSILNHKTMEKPEELNFIRFVGRPVRTYRKYLRNETTGEMLPLSRESLFQLLEPKKTEIQSYVRTNGIRFRRIADFISVFQYHNSL